MGKNTSTNNEARLSLLRELAGRKESLLQAIWAFQKWKDQRLFTMDGRRLAVLSPGWLNRGPGPDFTESRIELDGTEYFGDVEVHIHERDWWGHGHAENPGYDRVVLHVVLVPSERRALSPVAGSEIATLDIRPYVSPVLVLLGEQEDELLEKYDQLPGRCGLQTLQAPPEALSRLIAQAAETRARKKSELIAPRLEDEDIEQVLFEKVFYYLGYRPQAEIFEKLARRHPLREMYLLLEKERSRAREEVLARWFGAAGILADTGRPPVDQGAENELLVLRHIWNDLGLQSLSDTVARRSSRPWNTPERRLAGFFNHLHILAPGGYLKGWLAFLRRLDGLRNQPDFRKAALRELEGLFDTPPGDPWKSRYNYHSASARSARLIGMDRIIMLMANAVLPFFLAYARSRKDREFEKLLYRLYLVLPPEASNNRTRFMENRLLCFASQKPSLRSQQGLLQIHQDFCISYHEGCHQCTLPDLL